MNKFTQKSLLLATAATLLILVTVITPAVSGSNGPLNSEITVTTELNNISQADIEGVKKEVRTALSSIPQLLGIEYKKTTTINLVDTGICYASGGIVSISISHIRDRSAPVIHEITHIIAKHKYNSFFSEGLAVYFQERFGKSEGFPNFSESLDELVRNNKDQLLSILQLTNDNEIFEQVGTERRKIAYIEAGSFINFLVVKYGEQKLADLHNSSSLNYKKVYGKNINELEAEWRDYIFGASLIKT